MHVHVYDGVELAGEAYRTAARKITACAIRVGWLRPQPCEVCGRRRSIHGHHVDYSRPLDVRWLCKWCHLDAHREGEPVRVELLASAVAAGIESPRAAYVVDGETWTDLLRDLQRQVFLRAQAAGFANTAQRLRISPTTLWRFGKRCQYVQKSDVG